MFYGYKESAQLEWPESSLVPNLSPFSCNNAILCFSTTAYPYSRFYRKYHVALHVHTINRAHEYSRGYFEVLN